MDSSTHDTTPPTTTRDTAATAPDTDPVLASTRGPSLGSVPAEVLLEYLLPDLPLADLFSLGGTSRYFRSLTLDPSVWRTKTLTDFSFTPSTLAPPSRDTEDWYRRVYLGIRRPRTFVWGSTDNSRLGNVTGDPRLGPGVIRHVRGVDAPMEVSSQFHASARGRTWFEAFRDSVQSGRERVIGTGSGWGAGGVGRVLGGGEEARGGVEEMGKAGIVELQAGGWSFTARDMNGGVWVWGQLDGTLNRFSAPSWEDKNCQCPDPTRIPLPCRAEAISAGRQHLLVLDSDNLIWELRAWGRAFHHTAPSLTSPSSPGSAGSSPHVSQLSTGWTHSACLTRTGRVFVWFPFSPEYEAALTPEPELLGPLGADEDDLSRVLRWGTVRGDCVVDIEPVPRRPSAEEVRAQGRFGRSGPSEEEEEAEWKKAEEEWEEWEVRGRGGRKREETERVVKIASGLEFVLALKANGEVWVAKVQPNLIGPWVYLPYFSSPQITHISAQFETIASYSPPTALSPSPLRTAHLTPPILPRGSDTPWSSVRPNRLAELDGVPVIQFVAGDYHNAALTSTGEMYAWGQNGRGQLGTGWTGPTAGNPTSTPTKVVFKSPQGGGGEQAREAEGDAFVFAITAAGRHTGALVLGDLKAKKGQPAQSQTVRTPFDQAVKSTGSDGSGGLTDAGPSMPGAFPSRAAAKLAELRARRSGTDQDGPTTSASSDPASSATPDIEGDTNLGRRLQLPPSRTPVVPRPGVGGDMPGLHAPTFRIGYAGRGAMIGRGRGVGGALRGRAGVGRGVGGAGGEGEQGEGAMGEGQEEGSERPERETGAGDGEEGGEAEASSGPGAPVGNADVF